MEVNNLANIKSAIKRAELNVKQNEKNSAQKSAMRTAIKAFEAKQKLKVWSTRTKLAVIKHVLQRNLVNQEQHKNQALRSFFCS